MLGPVKWLRNAALVLALCAGGAGAGGMGASIATPKAADWKADPDDQYLLDVNLRQLGWATACAPTTRRKALVSS